MQTIKLGMLTPAITFLFFYCIHRVKCKLYPKTQRINLYLSVANIFGYLVYINIKSFLSIRISETEHEGTASDTFKLIFIYY